MTNLDYGPYVLYSAAAEVQPVYSATKQDSKTFQNHYFGLNIAQTLPTCYRNGHYNH